MQFIKSLDFYQKNRIPSLLLLLFFLSFGFGSSIINSTLLIFILYFFINIKSVKFNYLDKILIFFGIYILLSSLLNFNYFLNSFLFLKFILFTLSMKLILSRISEDQLKNLIKICSLFLIFLVFDVFYQKLFGVDIFGYEMPNLGGRLSGPFQDKLIPGTLILYLGFYFFLYFYLKFLSDNNFIKHFISLTLLSLFTCSILITGERMNFVSSLLSIFLIFMFVNEKKFHFLYSTIALLICFFIIINDKNLYQRYEKFISLLKPQLDEKSFHEDEIEVFKNENNIKHSDIELSFLDTTWGAHYLTAFELIKKKPVFGNGIKSFRDLCGKQKIKSVRKQMRCSTHPHNIHLELLSEIGLIGYSIFIILTFIIMYEAIKIIINKKRYSKDIIFLFFSASFILCITLLFPIKSTGRFSSTFFGSIYWINFSILYSSIYFLKKKYSLNLEKK